MPSSIYCVLAVSQPGKPVLARVTVAVEGHAQGGAGRADLLSTARDDVLKTIQDAEQLLFELLEGVSAPRIISTWLGRGVLPFIVRGACVFAVVLACIVFGPFLLATLGVNIDTSGMTALPGLLRILATGLIASLVLGSLIMLVAAEWSVRQCKELMKDLRSRKLSIALADPLTDGADDVIYSGNSGGLSFLLTLMLATLQHRQIEAWFPWLHGLMSRQVDVVCTATLNRGGKIGSVGEIRVKLGAIRPDASTFWILSNFENRFEVEEYYRESNNGLILDHTRPARGDYQFYRSQDKRHAFLFIRHIDDLARFFSPSRAASIRPLIAVGAMCSVVAMAGAWMLPGGGAPEFTISRCGLGSRIVASNERAQAGAWAAGQTIIECVVSVKPDGYPGPLDVEVKSSVDNLLPGDAQTAPANERNLITRRLSGVQHYSFFVKKPDAASAASSIIIGVVVRNMAGRQSSAAVVLSPQPPGMP